MIMILIYEYNVIVEARKTTHKSNWLDLMNNSADGPTLQERFNKANINIDRTTLKLLPILIKALNQDRYEDKVVEESTSLYPPYEVKDTTDTAYTKNIFADTRNWMKMRNSRLYTIEYKTSPIVYFKNPTRNIDYFTKIRKIRDYQRIMNYVDKMISEKNLLGSTQPLRSESYTDRPITMTKPMRKDNLTKTIVNKQTSTPKLLVEEKKPNCKCTHKLGPLMHKLLTSIQHLLSYFSASNVNKTIYICKDSIQPKPLETINHVPVTERQAVTTSHHRLEPVVITTTSAYKNFLNRHKYTVDFAPTNNFDTRRDYTINTIMNLLKPNFKKHSRFETKFEPNDKFSTPNSYVEPTEINKLIEEASSESILKYMAYTNTKTATDVTTVADYILQKGRYDASSETNPSPSVSADTDFTTDDDYYTETTANLGSNYEKLDTHSLELVKSKIVPGNKYYDSKEKKSVKYNFKGPRANSNVYHNIGSMRKVGNLVSNGKNNSKPVKMLHRFAPISKPILKSTTPKTILPFISTTEAMKKKVQNVTKDPILYKEFVQHKSAIKIITTTEKTVNNETKFRYFNKEPIPKDAITRPNQTTVVMLEETTDPAWEENISKETILKHIEEEMRRLNNETVTNKTEQFATSPDDQWELVKLEEKSTSTKSMVPPSRSTYLEMQRNDWKHDENQDYDTNMNNNIYD